MLCLRQSILSDDFLHGVGELRELLGSVLQLLLISTCGEDAFVGQQIEDNLFTFRQRESGCGRCLRLARSGQEHGLFCCVADRRFRLAADVSASQPSAEIDAGGSIGERDYGGDSIRGGPIHHDSPRRGGSGGWGKADLGTGCRKSCVSEASIDLFGWARLRLVRLAGGGVESDADWQAAPRQRGRFGEGFHCLDFTSVCDEFRNRSVCATRATLFHDWQFLPNGKGKHGEVCCMWFVFMRFQLPIL